MVDEAKKFKKELFKCITTSGKQIEYINYLFDALCRWAKYKENNEEEKALNESYLAVKYFKKEFNL